MDIKAKLRPFYVAKMLYEQTDEDHYLTIAQMMEQLTVLMVKCQKQPENGLRSEIQIWVFLEEKG